MKNLILIFNLLFLFSCTNLNKKNFIPMKEVLDKGFSFEVGDILILNKVADFYSIFGHSALLLGETVVEYPAYGYGCIEASLTEWLEFSANRKITVLRANLDLKQKEQLIQEVYNYSDAKYGVFNRKMGTSEFYCSSFIWRVYYNLGINLDKNFKIFVLPYDFLKSKNLEAIKMQENP